MGEALFTFRDVTVDGDDRPRLTNVDVTVPEGAVTVIVGPSGAGKSTLLRLCNRLEVPSTGTVLFRGSDISSIDPLHLRRRVGMVFQRPIPFPGSVRDNLLVADPGASALALTDALEQASLDISYLDRDAERLSGGETQRMCLARTLLTTPEVLLMDEPTSSLDAGPRAQLEGLTRRFCDSGLPVLWVTHDLDQARRLADHVIVLAGGRVVAHGGGGDVALETPIGDIDDR